LLRHLFLLAAAYPTQVLVTHWHMVGDEVSSVVERESTLCAVEVKSGRDGKARGLDRFRRHSPECTLVVGPEGMPLPTFFETQPRALFGD